MKGSGGCLDCAEEVVQREGTKLASRQEFAKRVALDLFRFMESFNKGVQGDTLILPTNCLELWFQKFDNKFRRYSSPPALIDVLAACCSASPFCCLHARPERCDSVGIASA